MNINFKNYNRNKTFKKTLKVGIILKKNLENILQKKK